ncbi:MarR family winged helix-turn-helix transcriptional regulator [Streptosporangium sp. G11]|uniref:MarR family winged helix-turn-helix transcriptional regulator n=1 Tax=Streptosporangium sp. G11 TaxID=3436926 RepID=UPI003EC11767
MGRSARKEAEPDLGMLAARLLFGVQEELFRRAAELGFDDIGPRHGGVMAYLDEEGIGVSELVRLTGRSKQTTGAILDELEKLGYLRRAPDPADRRARLIMPTPRGLDFMRVSDALVADIEDQHVRALGKEVYAGFKSVLGHVAARRELATDPS